jgi:hypothetical protein
MKWQENNIRGTTTSYRSCRIDRTTLNSGGHLYYVFWSEHCDWAAPHHRMSMPLRSLQSAKHHIDLFLDKEAHDLTFIVMRFNDEDARKIWAARRAA